MTVRELEAVTDRAIKIYLVKEDKMKTYTTPEGLKLLTDWNEAGSNYTTRERAAIKAAQALQNKLIFEAGERERDARYSFGLPYTSSSAYAALWNTNAQARKPESLLYFRGVAMTVDNKSVIIWDEYNKSGEELRSVYEVIK